MQVIKKEKSALDKRAALFLQKVEEFRHKSILIENEKKHVMVPFFVLEKSA